MLRIALLSLSLFLVSCAVAPPPPPEMNQLNGLWGGTGSQKNNTLYWPIKINFTERSKLVFYPKMGDSDDLNNPIPGCTAYLSYYDKGDNGKIFYFNQETSRGTCHNGFVKLTLLNPNRIRYEFFYDHNPEGVAELERYTNENVLENSILSSFDKHTAYLKRKKQIQKEEERKAEEAAEEKAKAARWAEFRREEEEKKRRETQRRQSYAQKKHIGQQVCLDARIIFGLIGTKISAYVEQVSQNNIKLRIDNVSSGVRYKGSELYSGKIIWDDYRSWRDCNK